MLIQSKQGNLHFRETFSLLNYRNEDFPVQTKFDLLNIHTGRREINRLFPIVEHTPLVQAAFQYSKFIDRKNFRDFYQLCSYRTLRKGKVFGGKQKFVKPSHEYNRGMQPFPLF